MYRSPLSEEDGLRVFPGDPATVPWPDQQQSPCLPGMACLVEERFLNKGRRRSPGDEPFWTRARRPTRARPGALFSSWAHQAPVAPPGASPGDGCNAAPYPAWRTETGETAALPLWWQPGDGRVPADGTNGRAGGGGGNSSNSDDDGSAIPDSRTTWPPGEYYSAVSQGDALLLSIMDHNGRTADEWMDLLRNGPPAEGGVEAAVGVGGGLSNVEGSQGSEHRGVAGSSPAPEDGREDDVMDTDEPSWDPDSPGGTNGMMDLRALDTSWASGSLGAPVVRALLEAGFQVTAIAREASTSTYPEGVEVRKTDLASVESLTRAFAGQDVVVLTIPHSQSDNQIPYIDAAVAAGVKRFIPAEWGFNTRPGKLSEPVATILESKTRAVDYLIEKAKEHPELTWTGIATGPFLDWGLDRGAFGIDPKAKTIQLVDSGDEPVSTCSIAFIARAVAAVLRRERETANRYLEVVEHKVTQNAPRRRLGSATGSEIAVVARHRTADLARSRDEKLARRDPTAFFEALWVLAFADGAGMAVRDEDVANAELGLKSADLDEILREYVRTRGI
ncbi:hypothetical protein VTG60DRAFT_1679 [Thermothelomyces hinnuleus]